MARASRGKSISRRNLSGTRRFGSPLSRASVSPLFLLLAFAAALFAAGCSKKTLSKSEIRSITAEIVRTAQAIVGPKSEITIRPSTQNVKGSSPGRRTETIYISPSDSQQVRDVTQALIRLGQRRKFRVDRKDSAEGVVLDYLSHGIRTHSIHIARPVSSERAAVLGGAPQLAIILDDLGYDRSAADSLLALRFPLTVSVIPHLPLSSEIADAAFRHGDQVLLHLPMQSESPQVKHESIELRVGMDSQQVQSTLAGMLKTVPHAVGVNNHEGSLATADPALMRELMPALRRRGLFFIDSRTTDATVAYTTAERAGVRAASRKVFLDDTPTKQAVRAQLELAAHDAARNGSAIAIGHPHPATIAALAETLPQLKARGIRLVFASELVR
jgi:uncharacterized protein